MELLQYALLAMSAAGLGAVGGLGGAVLLVPALVLLGMSPAEAAPLGLLSVAAGSISAAPSQLRDRSVNHRIGIVTELAAVTGAVAGATIAGALSPRILTYLLAGAAAAGAVLGLRRAPSAALVDPAYGRADVGERVGRLAGAYPAPGGGVVPYEPRRLPTALGLMTIAGLVAGTAGTSGGFIKTPTETEVMGLPLRVATATTTFTVGITASAALLVAAIDGRLDLRDALAVVAGSLLGGQLGAGLQRALPDRSVRRLLALVLGAAAVVLVVRA